jgi:hypothetical protein
MDLKRWISEQQQRVKIDKNTQFLASFTRLFPSTDNSIAIKISNTLQNYCKKVVNQVATLSVKHRFMPNYAEALVVEHGKPIYHLACRLIERMLERESLQGVSAEACKKIVQNHVFLKSMVVYASSIQLYSQSVIVDLPF